MEGKNFLKRFIYLIFGLYLCGWGLTFFYFNGLGLDSWNVLHDGLSKVLNVEIGVAFITVSIVVLLIAMIMGEKLGLGTICNALLMGTFMQININMGIIKTQTNIVFGLMYILVGMIITGFGYYFYMGAGFGVGPRDSFVMALSRRINLKMGYMKSAVEVLAVIIGFLLGGNLGIATPITAIFTGIIIQKVFDIMKFNPKNIKQEDLLETLSELKNKAV